LDDIRRVSLPVASPAPDEDVSFQDLVAILWRGKWAIAITALITAAATTGAAFLMRPVYDASVVVMPSAEEKSGLGGAAGSLLSQYGGLASLVGLSINGDSRKVESVAVLHSEALTEQYIAANDLLPVLFWDKWDAKTKKWTTTDPQKTPTLWKANQFFKKQVRGITEDKKTGLVTLTIRWTDPVVAAKWANGLVRMTNEYLRDKAIRESERNIAYLNEQISKTNVVEVQKAVYSVLETEIKKVMLARGSEEYALRVVDPAIAPERPTSPVKRLWALAGFAVGLFLSVPVVIARATWARKK
jgi:uncharacterized protein involved in exopolysaccharide biosynthesis